MKKLFTFFLAILIVAVSIASSPVNSESNNPVVYASEIFIPIGKTGKKISLLELSTITKSDLEKITGNKMSNRESRTFYRAQKKLQRGINDEGIVTSDKLKQLSGQGGDGIDGQTGFHLGGFALGFLLGLIGVLIAYLIKDEKKKNRTKWAWIGVGALLVLSLLFFI